MQSRKFYWCAIACLAVATVFAIVNYFTHVIVYIAFGLLSQPNYKRGAARRTIIIRFIISRLVIAAAIIEVIVYIFIGS